jgi:hypothetical protein
MIGSVPLWQYSSILVSLLALLLETVFDLLDESILPDIVDAHDDDAIDGSFFDVDEFFHALCVLNAGVLIAFTTLRVNISYADIFLAESHAYEVSITTLLL